MKIEIRPEMLRWARERAGLGLDEVVSKFAGYAEWEGGDVLPTLMQLEGVAQKMNTPVGYFFLDAPPDEPLPIPDLRTLRDRASRRPGPDLLETIYLCLRRQDWYRDYCLFEGYEPLSLVGSARLGQSVEQVAASMREAFGFGLEARSRCGTWRDALDRLLADIDDAGIMVMRSGVVFGNGERELKVGEFRGFVLADEMAPLVFINGGDARSAQMLTLAHGLAHLWLGESALFTAHIDGGEEERVERWCNEVAAEMLLPLDALRADIDPGEPVDDAVARLVRRFKVGPLVVLRRLFDLGFLDRSDLYGRYDAEVEGVAISGSGESSDGLESSQIAGLSRRFGWALIGDTLEGRTLYRDALRLAGLKRVLTLHEIGRRLGFSI
ncbi:ImmA/IrrE family metallo-endopeptidase [Thioalkalivibrio sp. HK1]|uniref:ImmA/IrrE family metallo-endopeptidase n=1 Tax=Thioalkalivibrio sp. HK1 TaxID=1469245 RepID=UPI000471BEC6|nr:ImmA/IrrE family metallo-endopeptidase [Thioalkalivibrio sp. HK1]